MPDWQYEDEPFEDDLLGDDADAETLPCPSCGTEVYEETQKCPVCGEWVIPLRNQQKSPWVQIVALAILLMFALAVVLGLFR